MKRLWMMGATAALLAAGSNVASAQEEVTA